MNYFPVRPAPRYCRRLTLVRVTYTSPALDQIQKRFGRVRQRGFAPVDEPQDLFDLHSLDRNLDQRARFDLVLDRQPRQDRYASVPHHEIFDRFERGQFYADVERGVVLSEQLEDTRARERLDVMR